MSGAGVPQRKKRKKTQRQRRGGGSGEMARRGSREDSVALSEDALSQASDDVVVCGVGMAGVEGAHSNRKKDVTVAVDTAPARSDSPDSGVGSVARVPTPTFHSLHTGGEREEVTLRDPQGMAFAHRTKPPRQGKTKSKVRHTHGTCQLYVYTHTVLRLAYYTLTLMHTGTTVERNAVLVSVCKNYVPDTSPFLPLPQPSPPPQDEDSSHTQRRSPAAPPPIVHVSTLTHIHTVPWPQQLKLPRVTAAEVSQLMVRSSRVRRL